ncbi:MAG: ATP-binding protein [Microlunatus sp.]|nr:ATP-binding protein [Microlunatus sp.]
MNWVGVLLGVLGLLVGIGLGVAAAALQRRSRQVDRLTVPERRELVVPEGVRHVLAVIRSAGVVAGPHDEVIESTPLALNLGLTRGSRIVVPRLLELVRQARQTQQMIAEEVDVRRGSRIADTDLLLDIRVAPMSDGIVLVLADDLTDARRVEATRRDFVANVSHELKTPIGAIALLAEAVGEAADDAEAVRRFASRIEIESARLVDLVSQIIVLSRLQADDPMGRAEPVAVDDILAEGVDRCRVDAERQQVMITIAGDQGLYVAGNQLQLSTAIGNLVENALVYSEPGARVVVAARRQIHNADDYVDITVSDNGIGIPPDHLERIFERFYRVDYARSRANGGSGLGLSIVKHIATVHHGEVLVWSQPGRGSTFTMRLPEHQPLRPTTEAATQDATPDEKTVEDRDDAVVSAAGSDPSRS